MKKSLWAARRSLALAAALGIAYADETRGRITQIARDKSSFTLSEGREFVLAKDVLLEGFQPGAEVRVRFEQRGATRIARQAKLLDPERARAVHPRRAASPLDQGYLGYEWRELCW